MKHVVEEYTDTDYSAISEAWVDSLEGVPHKDTYIGALQHDPVALGQDIFHLIQSSSLCQEGFTNTIKTGNPMNWFTDEDGNIMQLPLLELLQDVKS